MFWFFLNAIVRSFEIQVIARKWVMRLPVRPIRKETRRVLGFFGGGDNKKLPCATCLFWAVLPRQDRFRFIPKLFRNEKLIKF